MDKLSMQLGLRWFASVVCKRGLTSGSCAGSNGSISDPYRLYNLDVFEHAADSPFGLYGSIPLLLAHKQGLSVGAFW